jgi:hypothetical protein
MFVFIVENIKSFLLKYNSIEDYKNESANLDLQLKKEYFNKILNQLNEDRQKQNRINYIKWLNGRKHNIDLVNEFTKTKIYLKKLNDKFIWIKLSSSQLTSGVDLEWFYFMLIKGGNFSVDFWNKLK